MIRNYIKIAWRNFLKNKVQSGINLLGLTAGTVCCLVIMLYVFAQMGYDIHHQDADSLYRIRTFITGAGMGTGDMNSATSSPPIPFAMKADFPEVVEACRLVKVDGFNTDLIRWTEGEQGYFERGAYLADSTIFKVFTFKFLEGDPNTALDEPNTVVVSSSLAKKLFEGNPAQGQTIEISGYGRDPVRLTVTGVYDQNFGKSHLKPNYIMSMNNPGLGAFIRSVTNYATQNFVNGYVKLAPGADVAALERKLPAFLMSHGRQQFEETGIDKTLYLQKVTGIHLHSKGIDNQIEEVSNIEYLYLLITLAVFIQLVACINFVNLSTARAAKRAKEIGVRKVIGANRHSLTSQFMGESIILSLFAVLLSFPIAALILPLANQLTEGNLGFQDMLQPVVIGALVALGVLTGVISGIYPALLLSSIGPIRALRGAFNARSEKGNLRKALVVFQFIVTIGLITAVIVMYEQYRFTQDKDLGFEKDHLIGIRLNTKEAIDNNEALRAGLLNLLGVLSIGETDYSPSQTILNDTGLYRPGKNPDNRVLVKTNGVGDDYFETLSIPLVAGRELKDGDGSQIVVNETFLKAFQVPLADALGMKFLSTYEGETQEFEIVGVARDFHFATLKDPITPLMLYRTEEPHWLIVKTSGVDYRDFISRLENLWREQIKNAPLVYGFVDQEVERLYAEEKRLGKIALVFTTLAILISCLGLFGLVSFVAEQKKKEIGIRKVLGASARSVVRLLTRDFILLVVIAFVIAAPLAYFFMYRWLEDFEYKIKISGWMFLVSGLAALLITLLTVGFQSLRSAMANPVKSLRTE